MRGLSGPWDRPRPGGRETWRVSGFPQIKPQAFHRTAWKPLRVHTLGQPCKTKGLARGLSPNLHLLSFRTLREPAQEKLRHARPPKDTRENRPSNRPLAHGT